MKENGYSIEAIMKMIDYTINEINKQLNGSKNNFTETKIEIKPNQVKPKPDYKVHYIGNRRTHDHNGIITIVSQLDSDKNIVYYGVSFCSPKDRFNKKYGVKLALHDMYTNMHLVSIRKKKAVSIIKSILCDLYALNREPSWATKLLENEIGNWIW